MLSSGNPEDKRLEEIQVFLANNGASTFAAMLYDVPVIFRDRAKYTMILAPTDQALMRLEAASAKTMAALSKLAPGVEIIMNHISILPTKKSYPMFTAMNGTKYGSSVNDISALGVRKTATIDGVTVLVIDQVIIQGDQIDRTRVNRNPGALGMLNYQNFINLVNLGQLEGKDLVSFCLSNPDINDMCNKIDENGENIFHKLIRERHEIDLDPGVDAREYYIKIHSGYKAGYEDVNGYHELEDVNNIVQVVHMRNAVALLDSYGRVMIDGDINMGTANNYAYSAFEFLEGLPDPIVKIAGSSRHLIMLDSKGKVFGLGYNVGNPLMLSYEQTKDQSQFYPEPVMVEDIPPIKDIAAGDLYTILLTQDNKLIFTQGGLGSKLWSRWKTTKEYKKYLYINSPEHPIIGMAGHGAYLVILTNENGNIFSTIVSSENRAYDKEFVEKKEFFGTTIDDIYPCFQGTVRLNDGDFLSYDYEDIDTELRFDRSRLDISQIPKDVKFIKARKYKNKETKQSKLGAAYMFYMNTGIVLLGSDGHLYALHIVSGDPPSLLLKREANLKMENQLGKDVFITDIESYDLKLAHATYRELAYLYKYNLK